MKKFNKPFLLLVLLINLIQANCNEANITAEDYLKMSTQQLDTAFISAVKKNQSEKIQALIKAGANINTPIPYTFTQGDCDWNVKSTALTYAVRNNHVELVSILLKEKNKINQNLNEILNTAIEEGYLGIVKELIKEGVDINQSETSPLIIAIQNARPGGQFSAQAQGQYLSRWRARQYIIEALLEAGANVSHVNKDGRTALMEAVINHDLNTVQKILEVPEIHTGSFFGFGTAPINYADKDGNTALILAIKHMRSRYIDNQEYNIAVNSQKIIEELLSHSSIDAYHVNKDGVTAVSLLEEENKRHSRY